MKKSLLMSLLLLTASVAMAASPGTELKNGQGTIVMDEVDENSESSYVYPVVGTLIASGITASLIAKYRGTGFKAQPAAVWGGIAAAGTTLWSFVPARATIGTGITNLGGWIGNKAMAGLKYVVAPVAGIYTTLVAKDMVCERVGDSLLCPEKAAHAANKKIDEIMKK